MKIPRLAAILAIVAGVGLTACSGVPTSSSPQVIGPVAGGVAPSTASIVTPPPGADERTIVQGFVNANIGEDAHHTSARSYLSADASKKWVDTTTLVVDSDTPGVANAVTHAVSITANKVGTVDAHGIYTPVTEGTGSTPISLTFGLTMTDGQWRINALSNGLIVTQSAFLQTYKPHPVYFFDQTQRRLLPDLRYSPLTSQTLCNWLLEQLTAGPRAELQSAFTSDLPEQTAHATVTFGATITVDLPGASQLDAATRSRLGGQLVYTFNLDYAAPPVLLTDNSKPVSIPSVSGPFTLASFPAYLPSPAPVSVYYVRAGVVISDSGKQAGPATGLNSIAVAQRGQSALLAATTGKADVAQLVVGQLSGPLAATSVPAGPLTRPAWAAGLQEVWVGDDSTLYRLTTPTTPTAPAGAAAPVVLASSSGAVTGQIRSVALSPDGVRIALILKAADGTSQLWIGTIVRTADGASIENLQTITPVGLKMTDVAWNDTSTLYLIGSGAVGFGIWSVEVDGSLLTPRSTAGLPSAPDSITTSQGGRPWVSANTAVWVQGGSENSWTAPGAVSGTTLGTSPTYVQ